ncbi:hypothetical protein GCM10010383_49580 [Streptomyces lomondensis]|uniref:Uncharacterized protein n=1 Tax=Streptomyces lomondensis TaxID=68229 RepID=A0ABQ2XF65_9ACTN|nr:hypothetical protein GCM10010383_49580 [Streptomyces lomondensis]
MPGLVISQLPAAAAAVAVAAKPVRVFVLAGAGVTVTQDSTAPARRSLEPGAVAVQSSPEPAANLLLSVASALGAADLVVGEAFAVAGGSAAWLVAAVGMTRVRAVRTARTVERARLLVTRPPRIPCMEAGTFRKGRGAGGAA